MVDSSILSVVTDYLKAINSADIHADQAVLFGSQVRGDAHPFSDIDLIVIAPEFDEPRDEKLIDRLWEARAWTDPRIEPIPCGERQWLEDDSSAIIEIARREGKVIELELEPA
ncbi:MAG: nucleotidyltransferase domain-containing protein [Chloroflexota bacterium]